MNRSQLFPFLRPFARALAFISIFAAIPTVLFAQTDAQINSACAAGAHMHGVGRSNGGRCVCDDGYVESNNQCVASGGGGGGGGGLGGALGAAAGGSFQNQLVIGVAGALLQGLFNGNSNQAAQNAEAERAREAAQAQREAQEAARRAEEARIAREKELQRQREFTDNKNKLLNEMGGADSGGMKFKDDDDASAAYDAKLHHFRELDRLERIAREKALAKLKDAPDEAWCRLHLTFVFPNPPITDPMNQYQNSVMRYDHQKQAWDARCGGPSAQEGYKSFSSELAALKRPQIEQTEKKLAMKSDDDDEKMKMPSDTSSANTGAAPSPSRADAHADSGSGGLAFKSDDDDARPAPHAEEVAEKTSPAVEEKESSTASKPDDAAEQKAAAAPDQGTAGNPGAATGQIGVRLGGVAPEDAGLDASPSAAAPKATAGFTPNGIPYAGMPAQRAQAVSVWTGIPVVRGMARAGAAPDVHMDPGIWTAKPPAAPDAWKFFHSAMDSLEKRSDAEARVAIKKSLKTEFGVYGLIQYNEERLSSVVLSGILSASSNPNMTEAEASAWYSQQQANNLQTLFNFGAAPSQVLAKAVELHGDVKAAVLEYGVELAKKKFEDAAGKLTDAAQNELIDGLSSFGGKRLAADKYRDAKIENRGADATPAEKFTWGNYLNNRQVNDTKEYQDRLKKNARNIVAQVQSASPLIQAAYGGFQ